MLTVELINFNTTRRIRIPLCIVIWKGISGRLSPYFIRIITGEIRRPFMERYTI